MAVPFRKTSKSAKRKRRTHFKITSPNLSTCKNCASFLKSHYVCKECGFYKGKEVLRIDENK